MSGSPDQPASESNALGPDTARMIVDLFVDEVKRKTEKEPIQAELGVRGASDTAGTADAVYTLSELLVLIECTLNGLQSMLLAYRESLIAGMTADLGAWLQATEDRTKVLDAIRTGEAAMNKYIKAICSAKRGDDDETADAKRIIEIQFLVREVRQINAQTRASLDQILSGAVEQQATHVDESSDKSSEHH